MLLIYILRKYHIILHSYEEAQTKYILESLFLLNGMTESTILCSFILYQPQDCLEVNRSFFKKSAECA